jgi:hypothetical protein
MMNILNDYQEVNPVEPLVQSKQRQESSVKFFHS